MSKYLSWLFDNIQIFSFFGVTSSMKLTLLRHFVQDVISIHSQLG